MTPRAIHLARLADERRKRREELAAKVRAMLTARVFLGPTADELGCAPGTLRRALAEDGGFRVTQAGGIEIVDRAK